MVLKGTKIMSLLEKIYLRKKGNLAYFDQQLQVYNRNWFEDHRQLLTDMESHLPQRRRLYNPFRW